MTRVRWTLIGFLAALLTLTTVAVVMSQSIITGATYYLATAPFSARQFSVRVNTATDPNRVELGCERDVITTVSGAVNGLRFAGGAAGANPTFTALACTGGDANIGLTFADLGTGGFLFQGPLTLTHGTITAAADTLGGTVTWNGAAVTFDLIDFDVTNTASAVGSRLLRLQVGAVDVLSLTRRGAMVLTANADVSPLTLTGGTVTTSNPVAITQTVNAGAVIFDLFDLNMTVTAQAAGSRFVNFRRGGTLQFAVTNGQGATGTRIRTAQATAPTCDANCGATGTVAGTDTAAVITTAGAGTASPITMTFNGTFETSAPACVAANQTTAANNVTRVNSTTTTAVIYFAAGPTAGDLISVLCFGRV